MFGYRENRAPHYTSKRIFSREYPVKGTIWCGAQVLCGDSVSIFNSPAITGSQVLVQLGLPSRRRIAGADSSTIVTNWNGNAQSIIPLTIPFNVLFGTTNVGEVVGASFISWPRQLTTEIVAGYTAGYWRLLECDHIIECINHTSVPVIFYMRMMRGATFPALPQITAPHSDVFGESNEWQRFICPAAVTTGAVFNQDAQPPGRLAVPIKLHMPSIWSDAGWRDLRPSDASATTMNTHWKIFTSSGPNAALTDFASGTVDVALQIVARLDHPKLAAASTVNCVKFLFNGRWKLELAKGATAST